MEVLLLDDIKGVGKRNDLIVVKDGFALNHLLPLRRALVATPIVRKRYAEEIRRRAEERAREKELRAGVASALDGKDVHFTRKVTKTGKLYAAISEKVIAEALKKEHSLDIPPASISIPQPIKALGEFEVDVKLGEREGKVKIIVENL